MDRDEISKLAVFAPVLTEDILAGARLLRRAFLAAPLLSVDRGTVLIPAGAAPSPAVLIQYGFAYQTTGLADGRRSIADILVPDDIVGAGRALLRQGDHEIIAATKLSYRLLKPETMRELMRDPRICLRVLALAIEARARIDRHLTAVTRLDARGRIASMILGVYERLQRWQHASISSPSFNLPLTQDQIADHLGITLVHVSRTLRCMREQQMVFVKRRVIVILDIDELRRAAAGERTRGSVWAQPHSVPAFVEAAD